MARSPALFAPLALIVVRLSIIVMTAKADLTNLTSYDGAVREALRYDPFGDQVQPDQPDQPDQPYAAYSTPARYPSDVERAEVMTCDDASSGINVDDIPAVVNEDYRAGPFKCYTPTTRYPRVCTCLLADCSADANAALQSNCELCSMHGGMYDSYDACMRVGEDPGEVPTGRAVYPDPTFAAGEPTVEDEIYSNPLEEGRSLGLLALVKNFFAHSKNGATTVGPVCPCWRASHRSVATISSPFTLHPSTHPLTPLTPPTPPTHPTNRNRSTRRQTRAGSTTGMSSKTPVPS